MCTLGRYRTAVSVNSSATCRQCPTFGVTCSSGRLTFNDGAWYDFEGRVTIPIDDEDMHACFNDECCTVRKENEEGSGSDKVPKLDCVRDAGEEIIRSSKTLFDSRNLHFVHVISQVTMAPSAARAIVTVSKGTADLLAVGAAAACAGMNHQPRVSLRVWSR